MTVRNAGNVYPQLSRDAAMILADIRSFVWADIDRMKSDLSDFDAKLPHMESRLTALEARVSSIETQMVTKAALDLALNVIHEKVNAGGRDTASNTTLIKTLSASLSDMQKKLDEVSQQSQRALSSADTVGTVMENKILSMRQNDVSQDTLRDLPAKVSALTERVVSMEKRWFAFVVIITPAVALLVSLGSSWLKGLFAHP